MENLAPVILGIVCIVIGIFNRKGNVSMLHSYHRKNVTEENRIPFGKMVGLGTIIVGSGIVLFGGFSALGIYTGKEIFTIVGTAIAIAGVVVGTAISLWAMIKYNKGIF